MSDHHYYYFHEDNCYHNDECVTEDDDGNDQRFELDSWPDTCAETQYWDEECTIPVNGWPADVSADDCQDQEEESKRCIMCFDDLQCIKSQSLSSCSISCQHNHLICRFCLDRLIIKHCSEVLHTPSTPSSINCPQCLADARFAHLRHFRPTSVQNGNGQSCAALATAYTEEQLKLRCGGASNRALEMMSKVAAADQTLAALSEDEQILKGNTDCYRCPKCQFGPVAHRACSDLASHHDFGGINNKCPKCGFFGRNISEWIPISASSKVRQFQVPGSLPFHFDIATQRAAMDFLLVRAHDHDEWDLPTCATPFDPFHSVEHNITHDSGNRDNNFPRHCLPKKSQVRIPRFQSTPRSAHRFGGR